MPPRGLQAWWDLIDAYEIHVAEYITAESPLYLPYLQLVRELILCPGIEGLEPHSSHLHPCFSVPSAGRGSDSSAGVITPRHNRDEHGYHIHVQGGSWAYEVYCPHTRSAVRAVRVAARRFGIRIGEPPRVQPEPHSLRRVWVVFPDGRFNAAGYQQRVIPMAALEMALWTADGRQLGQVRAFSVYAHRILGEFTPGPDYPSAEPLFRYFEELVNDQIISLMDDAMADIDALEIIASVPEGEVAVRDVQIYSDGGFSCRLSEPSAHVSSVS